MRNILTKHNTYKVFIKAFKITTVTIPILLVFTACSGSGTVIDNWPPEGENLLGNVADFDTQNESPDGDLVVPGVASTGGAYALENNAKEPDSEEALIYIYVCGAVCNPGVVRVPVGSIAEYALELAGGFADGANTVYVNLAAKVSDGQRIYVPYLDEAQNCEIEETNAVTEASGSEMSSFPVNINTADVVTLCSIPGIGESKANAIIEYRNNYGPFETPEDIKNVSGIGDASYARIASYICVR